MKPFVLSTLVALFLAAGISGAMARTLRDPDFTDTTSPNRRLPGKQP